MWERKVIWISALVIAFSIPLTIKLNSVAIVFGVLSLVVVAFREKSFNFDFLKSPVAVLLFLTFLVLLLGIIRSEDRQQGLKAIERNVSLIIFPLLVFKWRKYGVKIYHVGYAFAAGCLTLTVGGLLYCTMFLGDAQREIVFRLGHSYYTNFIRIHPTYLSIYIIFVIFFFLEEIRLKATKQSTLTISLTVIAIAYNICLLLFLRARMPIVAFGILGALYFILLLRTKPIYGVVISIVIGVVTIIIVQSKGDYLLERYGRNFGEAMSSRISVWHGAYEGVKISPVLGAGTGYEQSLIDQGYLKIVFDEGLDNSFNAHNQYLQSLARNGIFELACLLTLLGYCFKQSVDKRLRIFMFFCFLVIISMLTESILQVQKGIIYFYFFACVFTFLDYE